YLRSLEEKKEQVIGTIREQGKLTEELERQIREAATMVAVDDLYRPYRPKRRTRAMIAREKGLEPLAERIAAQEFGRPALEEAADFVSAARGVADAAEALAGAMDILAEQISDNAVYRTYIRRITTDQGQLQAAAKHAAKPSVYETYQQSQEPVRKCVGHRILALNRGEAEKYLTVKVLAPEESILKYLDKQIVTKENPFTAPVLREAAEDSYRRLIAPAIEREIRGSLTEK